MVCFVLFCLLPNLSQMATTASKASAASQNAAKASNLTASVEVLEQRVVALEAILASKLKERTAEAAQQLDTQALQSQSSPAAVGSLSIIRELAAHLKTWESRETEELRQFFGKCA